ncbi:MAG: PH domain-containing protein [Gaiellaceae bacterium]
MIRLTGEEVLYEARRHGIVLAGTITRALVLAAAGAVLVALGWPYSLAGAIVMAIAALVALRAVWRWDRTKLVVTSEQLYVVSGVLGRSMASVHLSSLGAIELEQTLLGRLLGYGTVIAGELEIDFVPQPRELRDLVLELAGSKLAA